MLTPQAVKSYLRLLTLSVLMSILVIAATKLFPSAPDITPALILTAGFTLTAFISLLIFFNGYSSDRERSVFMTLIALGVKMLLAFVLAMLFLLVFKNDSSGSIILFFILYLAFTVYVVFTFTSVLKKKSV